MIEAIVKVEKPEVPDTWDYGESVQRVKAFVYKWKNLTEEIARELWIAREVLSERGGDRKSEKFQTREITLLKNDSVMQLHRARIGGIIVKILMFIGQRRIDG